MNDIKLFAIALTSEHYDDDGLFHKTITSWYEYCNSEEEALDNCKKELTEALPTLKIIAYAIIEIPNKFNISKKLASFYEGYDELQRI